MRRNCVRLVLVVMVALLLTGCGGGDTETLTVTEQQTVTEPPVTTTVEVEVEPIPETTTEVIEPAPAEETIVVPDVVGLDHQLAQDTMQAAGLYVLDEEDATGAGRLLLFDRNWTVVSQDPPAGTLVNADQTILLRSKKDDE
jgi:PBP1b-binding outer membrane lipoprotein LpoB